jgi:hypothetical protein
MINLVDAYLKNHICTESPMFQLLQTRLKLTIGEVVKEQMIDGDISRTHWWLASSATQMLPACASGSRGVNTPDASEGARAAGPARVVSQSAPLNPGSFTSARDSVLGSPKTEWTDPSEDEPPIICRRRGSVDHVVVSAAVAAAPPGSASSACSAQTQTATDVALVRNGLTALETEVRLLGERIARVTTFHTAVYKDWYTSLLLSDA